MFCGDNIGGNVPLTCSMRALAHCVHGFDQYKQPRMVRVLAHDLIVQGLHGFGRSLNLLDLLGMFIYELDATGLAHEVLNAISLAALKFLLECAVRHDDEALCPKRCLIYKAGGDESEFRTCLRAIYALVLMMRSPQRCGSFSCKCFDTALCVLDGLQGSIEYDLGNLLVGAGHCTAVHAELLLAHFVKAS